MQTLQMVYSDTEKAVNITELHVSDGSLKALVDLINTPSQR